MLARQPVGFVISLARRDSSGDRESAVRKIRAGASASKITPPVGGDLAGYARREGSSVGVHDDLWCRTLVLDDGDTRLALVALDLLSVDFEVAALLHEAVAGAVGTAPVHVLVNCTHTHAGPVTTERQGHKNGGYVASLVQRTSETAAGAAQRLAPATIRYGEAPIRVGINRREKKPGGEVEIGRNPEGVVDTLVRVIEVQAEPPGLGAVLFQHACHGTTLDHENRMVSAEWIGAAASRLDAKFQGRSIGIFLQGCCGQINPDAGPSFDEVKRLGSEMAAAVAAALDRSATVNAAPLAVRKEQVGLPIQDPLTGDQARAELREAEARLERLRREGAHEYIVRASEGLVKHAAEMLKRAERGPRGEMLPFAIQAVRIGEVAIVGLSGEVFFEFAGEIEAKSPFARTLVLGYTNGCTCYIPTQETFAEGGYEAEDSFRWYQIPPLRPQAGDIMAAAAVRILEDLWRGGPPS